MKSLVVLAAACTPHVAEPPSAHVPLPARSSMHGTITSAVTREPLSGVVLLINPIDSFPGGRRPIDFNGPDFAQPTTNETGTVTSARGSGGAAADLAAERARTWRFAPYFVRGKPMAVCSFVRVGDPPEPDGDDE